MLLGIPLDWWSGIAASFAAMFAFTRTGKRALLWSTMLSGSLVSTTFWLAGDAFAGSVVIASLTATFLQGWLDERYAKKRHTVFRVIISTMAILVAIWLEPPTSPAGIAILIAYANGKVAHVLPNLLMKMWILPSTALWLAYAAYVRVYPIVLLESVTFIANLITISLAVNALMRYNSDTTLSYNTEEIDASAT